jgi:hypothetical protein
MHRGSSRRVESKRSKQVILTDNNITDALQFDINIKALQSAICHKLLLPQFKANVLHSIALPYCRDIVRATAEFIPMRLEGAGFGQVFFGSLV